MLWRIFDVDECHVVPLSISKRVKKAFSRVVKSNMEVRENPIVNVPLDVRGDKNGNLILTLLNDDSKVAIP